MRVAILKHLLIAGFAVCSITSATVYAEFADQIYGQGNTDSETDPSQINERLEQMQAAGQERGGVIEEYLDQTNDTLQRDQPTEREILNQDQAEQEIQQQRQNNLNQQYQEGFGQPNQHPYADAPNRPSDPQVEMRVNGAGAGGGRR